MKGMGRGATAILGLAVLAVCAVFLAKGLVEPKQEELERSKDVLNAEAQPRLVGCTELSDVERPKELPAPPVGADYFYLTVTVLFPGFATVEGEKEHVLVVDGGGSKKTLHSEVEIDDDGAYLTMIFRVDGDFESGRLLRGETEVIKRVQME